MTTKVLQPTKLASGRGRRTYFQPNRPLRKSRARSPVGSAISVVDDQVFEAPWPEFCQQLADRCGLNVIQIDEYPEAMHARTWSGGLLLLDMANGHTDQTAGLRILRAIEIDPGITPKVVVITQGNKREAERLVEPYTFVVAVVEKVDLDEVLESLPRYFALRGSISAQREPVMVTVTVRWKRRRRGLFLHVPSWSPGHEYEVSTTMEEFAAIREALEGLEVMKIGTQLVIDGEAVLSATGFGDLEFRALGVVGDGPFPPPEPNGES